MAPSPFSATATLDASRRRRLRRILRLGGVRRRGSETAWILGRLLDVPVAALILILLLPPLLALRLLKRRPSGERLLLISYGGEVAATLEKYASLSMYGTFNPKGFFERLVVIHYPALRPARTRIDERTEVIDLDVPGPFYLTSAVFTLARTARLALRECITCVRVGELPHLVPFGLMAGWVQDCPVVMSIHNDWEPRWPDSADAQQVYGGIRIRRLLENLLYPFVDEAWPVFGPWREVAIRRGVPARRVRDFPHGIDLLRFLQPVPEEARARWRDPEGRPSVVWAARIASDTYAHHLPDIVERTLALGVNPVFLLAGGGEREGAIRRELRRRCLEGAVRFLGYVPQAEVPWLTSMADVNLCLFGGKTTYEMMASGRPMVAYAVGWNVDEVRDGETALAVPEGDVGACAARIAWALKNPVEAARIGARARAWVLEHHEWNRVQALKASLYRDALTRWRRR